MVLFFSDSLCLCALTLAGGEPPRAGGELTFGTLAVVRTFCLRADACGFYIDQVDCFLSSRTAHKRTGRGPLVNHPGQRKGGEDSSSPLDSSLPPRRAYLGDSVPLLKIVWPNGGWNKFHLAYRFLIYRGHHQDEWL